jgi:acetyl coenzyme A synthetase (ADP forming)-like protein
MLRATNFVRPELAAPDEARMTLLNSDHAEHAVLKDGGSILIRAARKLDAVGIRELFEELSLVSNRNRFFALRRELPEAELAEMTSPDFVRTASLVAILKDGGRERIIGLGTFATAEGAVRRAEVAFAIADDHHGRGIGTVLLERLAGIARDAGIDELEADVLADNAHMLDVFDQSGFSVERKLEDGVVHVVFPTRETERLVAASLERERIAARESVRVFFEPTSVAVIGASRREGTIGRALIDNLTSAGFRGPIYPINPKATEVSGLPCFASVSGVGRSVDLAIVAVPANKVEAAVRDCAEAHVKGVVVISSGFAEASPEGRVAEERLRHFVRASGMRLVGPNCMGVLNATRSVSLNATFSPSWPPEGNVSMLSQSGALGIAMLDYAAKLNIGLSGFVSVGNKADVSSNDLLAYWGDDPHTKVIVLYLESFGNSRTFSRLAPEVARKKPIVAVKSGRSAAGTRAASSHSAALASLDVGVDAVFAQAGIIRTNTLEELFDVVALLSTQPVPRGPRVGVVTNAGGPGILLADACEAHGLALPALAPETLARLRKFLPPQAGLSNPVDMIASASPADYERTIDLVGKDPNIDSLVVIYIPPLVTKPEEIAQAIARGAGTVPEEKPVATVFLSSKGAPPVLSRGPRGKIPSYSFPENAAIALSAAVQYARFRERPRGTVTRISRQKEREIRQIVARVLHASGYAAAWLSPEELEAVLALADIPFARVVRTPPEPEAAARASVGFGDRAIVLKAIAPGLVHKSDVGAVVLGLRTAVAVREAASTVLGRVRGAGFAIEGFLLQEEVAGGIEALVGVTSDPTLGPLVVAGFGGVQVELLHDVAFRLTPVSDVDAREMLESLKAKRLLDGFRGSPPGDRDAFVDVILKVSALVEIMPELTELDLNPVKILPPGRGAVVVDGRLRLGPRAKVG